MNSSFLDISKKIADNFIKTIVFVDDEFSYPSKENQNSEKESKNETHIDNKSNIEDTPQKTDSNSNEESIKTEDDSESDVENTPQKTKVSSNENINHKIDPISITKDFAKQGKACVFFNYRKVNEKDSLLSLLKTSDVFILDWK